jgi:hypothetical protein
MLLLRQDKTHQIKKIMIKDDTNRKNWFIKRVGRKIYRTHLPGGSPADKEVYKCGQVILNKMHAEYLYQREKSWQQIGWNVIYFGTWDEREKEEAGRKLLSFNHKTRVSAQEML